MKIKGIILKQALQKLGIKQEVAAVKLGISRPTLSIWCNKDELTPEIISSIKQKLDIDLAAQLNITDRPATMLDQDQIIKEIKSNFEAQERLYKMLLAEKDERIRELKERLDQYEGKSKSRTA